MASLVESRLLRNVARALKRSSLRASFQHGRWGHSIKGAAAATNFVCAEHFEPHDLDSLLDLEAALQRQQPGGTAALIRSFLEGDAAELPPALRSVARPS